MYTDKIAAVCREVSSNSRDANREAGRAEIPVKISMVEPFELDSVTDQSIVFEDSGLGITPDRMADIFVKYAASTKRSTNEQVGGFGLGAKTPFAYSDTFTVITVCDFEGKRMKFIYTAMIDDSQKGKMVLFGSEEVDQDTGTKIVVPYSDEDRYKFEKEVFRATCLWDVRPELKGFQYFAKRKFEVALEVDTFKVIVDDDYFFSTNFIANIDGIPYPIQVNHFSNLGSFRNGIGQNLPIVLDFKTGELGISANREGIHYTEETIQAISTKMEEVKKSATQALQEYVECDDYIESCIRVNDMAKI
jgi:hypothetical protein